MQLLIILIVGCVLLLACAANDHDVLWIDHAVSSTAFVPGPCMWSRPQANC